jgi:hypothetical protein
VRMSFVGLDHWIELQLLLLGLGLITIHFDDKKQKSQVQNTPVPFVRSNGISEVNPTASSIAG